MGQAVNLSDEIKNLQSKVPAATKEDTTQSIAGVAKAKAQKVLNAYDAVSKMFGGLQ